MLCRNLGTADRLVRALIGVVALVFAFTAFDLTSGALAGVIAAAVGAIMLLTATIATCPLYLPFGLKTCRAS
ncbi:MAG: hypothetical protein RI967_830 [Planctomycetota bacterium]|jgi:membrane-bound ClpP family serine protease